MQFTELEKLAPTAVLKPKLITRKWKGKKVTYHVYLPDNPKIYSKNSKNFPRLASKKIVMKNFNGKLPKGHELLAHEKNPVTYNAGGAVDFVFDEKTKKWFLLAIRRDRKAPTYKGCLVTSSGYAQPGVHFGAPDLGIDSILLTSLRETFEELSVHDNNKKTSRFAWLSNPHNEIRVHWKGEVIDKVNPFAINFNSTEPVIEGIYAKVIKVSNLKNAMFIDNEILPDGFRLDRRIYLIPLEDIIKKKKLSNALLFHKTTNKTAVPSKTALYKTTDVIQKAFAEIRRDSKDLKIRLNDSVKLLQRLEKK